MGDWDYNPILIGVITLFVTGSGPPCSYLDRLWCTKRKITSETSGVFEDVTTGYFDLSINNDIWYIWSPKLPQKIWRKLMKSRGPIFHFHDCGRPILAGPEIMRARHICIAGRLHRSRWAGCVPTQRSQKAWDINTGPLWNTWISVIIPDTQCMVYLPRFCWFFW